MMRASDVDACHPPPAVARIDVFKAVAAQSPAIKDTKSYARWIRSVQE